jgi:orotate phosphoribosyltransferase
MLKRKRSSAEWLSVCKEKNAFWSHDGDPGHPHAELTGGQHTDVVFNARMLEYHPALLGDAAYDLLLLFAKAGGKLYTIDGFIGPQKGATELTHHLARAFHGLTRQQCFSTSPAKQNGRKNQRKKVFIIDDVDVRLFPRAIILPCEDVISTGGSIRAVIRAAKKAGAIVVPFILTLVNRSGKKEIEGRRIISLIDPTQCPMPKWSALRCPRCKEGSRAIRPKNNWYKLTQPKFSRRRRVAKKKVITRVKDCTRLPVESGSTIQLAVNAY